MFAQVSNAYEVLTDPEKKKVYDMYGEEGLKGVPPDSGDENAGNGAGFPGFGPGGGFSGMGRGGRHHNFHMSDPSEIFKQFFGTADPFAAETGGFPGMGGFGGMSGMGMGSSGMRDGGMAPMRQAEPIVYPFWVTLEDINRGTTKKMKITKVITHQNGQRTQEAMHKEIVVKPGWKNGTKVKIIHN